MQPFDLEKALHGAKVITRNGDEVTILATNSKHPTHPVIGELAEKHGIFALRWAKDGRYIDNTNDSEQDLFMLPVKKEVWVNVYYYADKIGNSFPVHLGGLLFDTEQNAKDHAKDESRYVKSIKIFEY